ncbi:MAG: SDR family oxidoreductase [Alphaproteobacteria bacterium]|nr:SDR family oxidoreductase [Alphaproteobacteria bacterium]
MDLGLSGRRAIVCAASKGLGKGCAMALAREGVEITILARGRETLEATAAEIRGATGAVVHTIVCDITTAEGRAAALAAVPAPDILVNNAGGPPPGDFRDWDEIVWQTAVNANMVTPIMLMRSVVDGMIARRFGRIVNITSTSVKAPIHHLGLSNGARAGLTGFVAGIARQVVAHNVTINNLLPGPFETDRLRSFFASLASKSGRSADEIRETQRNANPARRFGTADEFGVFCAFLCSAHASYLTGQNIVLDGGAYPGTF